MKKPTINQIYQFTLLLFAFISFICGKTDYAIYGTVLAIYTKLNA